MKNYCNAQTSDNKERIPKYLIKLILFAVYSRIDREIYSRLSLSKSFKKDNSNKEDYIFNYNGKNYPFSVFSDYNLQKFDKKILKSSKRYKLSVFRSLKLACSMDLVNPRIAIGNSLVGTDVLIIFQENGIDKVIDYESNLMMKKEDYYELFHYSELNVLDKSDLYNIYYVIQRMGEDEHINPLEFFTSTKEVFNELSKQEDFHFLDEKYDSKGENEHNHFLLGTDSDCLFFQKEDSNKKYAKLISELDKFTENPTIKPKHITYDKKKNQYRLKERNFEFFTFDILSDMIDDQTIKEKLLSNSRYGSCHKNAVIIARALKEEDKKTAYVVAGKIKINEIDYFRHSWVEIDEKNIVIDFNHNIVMNREEYYKLFEAEKISRTLISEMEDMIQTIVFDAKFDTMQQIYVNYFGEEVMRDLKKNEKVFQKR